MKQKSMLLVAVAALAALASCSQDETTSTNPGKSMNFRTSINNSSRAVATTTATLDAFNVTAFMDGAAGNYFTDLLVTKKGDVWDYEGTYYWPGEGNPQFNFYAYAPATAKDEEPDSANGEVSINKDKQTITGFTPKNDAVDQEDLIIAYTKKSSEDCSGGPVNLNFRHALSNRGECEMYELPSQSRGEGREDRRNTFYR